MQIKEPLNMIPCQLKLEEDNEIKAMNNYQSYKINPLILQPKNDLYYTVRILLSSTTNNYPQ